MAGFTIIAEINNGDETTIPENLFYKIYNNGTLYYTVGSAANDPNVSLNGDIVTIINVPKAGYENYALSVTQVDEAQNESRNRSNEINVGVISFYEVGFYEPGFYS